MNHLNVTSFADGTKEKAFLFPDGTPRQITGRDGRRTVFDYDGLHRIDIISYPGSSDKRDYDYDEHGLLARAAATNSDGSIITTWNYYDSRGRLTVQSTDVSLVKKSYDVRYQYDVSSRMRNLTYPNSEIVRYSYDGLGRIASVGGYLNGADYDGMGRIFDEFFTNGVTCQYDYSINGGPLNRTFIDAATFNRQLYYSYWADGQIKAEEGKSYLYDGQDRLKKVTGGFSQSYTFDQNGNWLTKTNSTTTTTYTYGTCNKISSYKIGSFTSSPKYNRMGSLTDEQTSSNSKDKWNYTYDREQQLTQVKKSTSVIAKYWYDAFGRRLVSQEGSTKTVTIYSGDVPLYETVAGTSTVRLTIYGPDGKILAKKDSGTIYWYHQDLRGDTVMITDSTAKVRWNAVYTPYGEYTQNVTSQTYVPRERFVGEQYDSSTGLYNFGFRHYKQGQGRFLTEDPIRSGANQYTYCDDDPENLGDPNGLFWDTLFDIGSVVFDIKQLWDHPTWENLGWLVVDVGCALVPGLPAIGGIVRAGKMTDKAFDAARAADKIGDLYEVRNAEDLTRLLDVIGDRTVRVKALEDLTVFRTYAGHEGNYMEVARRIHGGSWTTIDPRSVSKADYIKIHGIPVSKNPSRFIATGKIPSGREFAFRKALAAEGFPGGGPDILNRIPGPYGPIDLSSVDIIEWAIPY